MARAPSMRVGEQLSSRQPHRSISRRLSILDHHVGLAGGSRNPELVGVDPIDASVASQDEMAYALYAIYGNSPWPVCGEYLP